jgi:hypothetical protein
MTIVVGLAAPDGLILAADSRTTLSDGGRSRVLSDTTQKVFSIYSGKFGVSCYGTALYENKTVAGHMDEFEASLTAVPKDASELARELGNWFQASLKSAYAAQGTPWTEEIGWRLGFHVAGYGPDGIGRLFDVKVPGKNGPILVETQVSTASIGVLFEGQTDVIRRLLGGVDSDALVASGVQVPKDFREALAGLEYNLLFPHTVQDAIDCANFLIRTTIGMQRFSDGTTGNPGGVPGCGGAIRILAIGRKEWEWVARPQPQRLCVLGRLRAPSQRQRLVPSTWTCSPAGRSCV